MEGGYKRQMDMYQWILEKTKEGKDYQVSNKLFCLCRRSHLKRKVKEQENKADYEFRRSIAYLRNDSWVEDKIRA